MRRVRVYQVDAFTNRTFAGNPAGVVPDAAGLSDHEMQAIARELNNSETAFILPPDGDDHDVWVRFFTPTTEVPICGHATIAAHHVRAVETSADPTTIVQRTGAGLLPVEIGRTDGGYRIWMTQARATFQPALDGAARDRVLDALGLEESDLGGDSPVQIVSTGHSKVLVPLRSRATLDRLRPDLPALTRLSGEIGCNGYFPFVLDGDDPVIQARGRMFAPAIGIPEDPVTGNANGPLGAYAVHHGLLAHDGVELRFRARQGEAMGRPGELEVAVRIADGEPARVRIAGEAVVVFRAELTL